MRCIELPIDSPEGLMLFEPILFNDNRGYFYETFSKKFLGEAGISLEFVQDNESCSAKNVLRGLHFQKPPYEQGKLVRVIYGSVYDIAVDIRKKSKTFGRHFAVELNDRNKRVFWIPAGFAHGFVSMEENTIVAYKCTKCYNRESEGGIVWNDADLNIQWKCNEPELSEKDKRLPAFKTFDNPF